MIDPITFEPDFHRKPPFAFDQFRLDPTTVILLQNAELQRFIPSCMQPSHLLFADHQFDGLHGREAIAVVGWIKIFPWLWPEIPQDECGDHPSRQPNPIAAAAGISHGQEEKRLLPNGLQSFACCAGREG